MERFIGVDKYENIYSIDKNIFFKTTDQKQYQFSALQLGEITSVDILNPLKIVLFYKELNTVVILDDKLNEIERVRFNEFADFRDLSFATKAEKNTLWIFNKNSQELEVFDYKQNKTLAKSFPIPEKILDMKSNFNYCWILTSKSLKRFNIYGSFLDEFPVNQIFQINFYNKYVLMADEEGLIFFDYKKQKPERLRLPQKKIESFYSANENIYIYDGINIHHYTFNPPK